MRRAFSPRFMSFPVKWKLLILPLLSLCIYKGFSEYSSATELITVTREADVEQFEAYHHKNTFTLHNVCLTNARHQRKKLHYKNNPKWSLFARNRTFHLHNRACNLYQKGITVYQNISHEMARSTSKAFKHLGFYVNFKREQTMPEDYEVIKDQTAFFLGFNKYPFEPYNFFHFTKQIFFPLYWLVKSTKRFFEGAQNILFFGKVYGFCDHDKIIYYKDNYQAFRDMIHVQHDMNITAFMDVPLAKPLCYKNAVFSTEIFLDKAGEAIEYFKNSTEVSDELCKSKQIVIINRASYRRILNVSELIDVGKSLGYDTREVFMEKFSIKEQAQLIHCANVLVGVAGAGLQWAFFMRNHSGVVEIAWPDKEWPFFFTGEPKYNSEENGIRPLKFTRLHGRCHINPPALKYYVKELFGRDLNISDQHTMEIMYNKENYNYFKKSVTSIGKLCDVTVSKKAFMDAILRVAPKS